MHSQGGRRNVVGRGGALVLVVREDGVVVALAEECQRAVDRVQVPRRRADVEGVEPGPAVQLHLRVRCCRLDVVGVEVAVAAMDKHGVEPDEIDVRRGRGGAAERGEGPVRLEGIGGIGEIRPVADVQRVIPGAAVQQHGHREAAQVLGCRADGDDVVAAAGHDVNLGHGRQVEKSDHAVDVRPEE